MWCVRHAPVCREAGSRGSGGAQHAVRRALVPPCSPRAQQTLTSPRPHHNTLPKHTTLSSSSSTSSSSHIPPSTHHPPFQEAAPAGFTSRFVASPNVRRPGGASTFRGRAALGALGAPGPSTGTPGLDSGAAAAPMASRLRLAPAMFSGSKCKTLFLEDLRRNMVMCRRRLLWGAPWAVLRGFFPKRE